MQLKPDMHYLWSRDNADQAQFHHHLPVKISPKISRLIFSLNRDKGASTIIRCELGMFSPKMVAYIRKTVVLHFYLNYQYYNGTLFVFQKLGV